MSRRAGIVWRAGWIPRAGTHTWRIMIASLYILAGTIPTELNGQVPELRRISATISYVTPGSVYFNAGSLAGLQSGDTLNVARGASILGRTVISAISSTSSAGQLLPGAGVILVGDSVFVYKHVESMPAGVPSEMTTGPTRMQSRSELRQGPQDNIVSGRLALQYAGAGLIGTSMDFSQPSLLLRLGIDRLFGTGLRFIFYGRGSYDLGNQYTMFGGASRTATRIYEMNLSYDNSHEAIGYSIGRIISPFLGGLGQFDGGQFFVRAGRLSIGLAAGAQADPRNSSIDLNYQKAALFLNYSWTDNAFRGADATVAYGQQRFEGKLDRDFLYTQLSLRPAAELNFYGSSEFDLHDVSNGTRISRLHLASTFITLSYTPLRWLTVSSGYDATRSIYLFESMKSFPDTLLNRELQQGIRGGVTFRLPLNALLMTNATIRPGSGGARRAYTLNAVLRMSDIAASGMNTGLQYTSTVGIYTTGQGIAVDADTWISQTLVLGARLDHYAYTIINNADRLAATTLTLNANVRISRSWYFLINLDQVWDTLRKSQRIYGEVGLHF